MSIVLETAQRNANPDKIEEWKARREGEVPASFLVAAEKPLTGEEYATFVKLHTDLPQIPNQVNKQAGTVHCTGCTAAFADAQKLIYHAHQCSKVMGHGNVTRRHNAACDALARRLRESQIGVQREAEMRLPSKDGAPELLGYMDLMMDHYAIDLTVSGDPKRRIAEKTRKYAAVCKHHHVRFHALVISPTGGIAPQSLSIARRLAKKANMSFNEFWAPVAVEVIRGTVRAVIETRNLISSIAAHNNSRVAQLSLAGPSTVPAHPHTSSLAQDDDAAKSDLVGDIADDPAAASPDGDSAPSSDTEEEGDEIYADAARRRPAAGAQTARQASCRASGATV